MATAMGRSYAVPDFLTSLGAKLMVTCSRGIENPLARSAQRTRERASSTEESGMPTMSSPGRPPDRLTSTVTSSACTPLSAAARTETGAVPVIRLSHTRL